ncbi:MAG: acetolactate synthase small subunit [Gammaproteobacteria bacterium]|nr:acetolactate synthase small subunit [Gammaproteobacteria bacterium]
MKLSDAGSDLDDSVLEAPAAQPLSTLSVYVNNKPGVLMRICQVFSRRAYNIDSLVVSHGRNRAFSRMSIGVTGDPEGLHQIIQQVNKLIDVIHCVEHDSLDAIAKELALIKVKATPEESGEIVKLVSNFDCEIVDLTENSIIFMVHGDSEKTDWVLKLLAPYHITETIRSGKIVIAKTELAT